MSLALERKTHNWNLPQETFFGTFRGMEVLHKNVSLNLSNYPFLK